MMKKYYPRAFSTPVCLAIGLFVGLCMVATTASANTQKNVSANTQKNVVAPEQVSFDAIPVCYDFNCRTYTEVKFSDKEKQDIKNRFIEIANTPEEERQQIRQAIGWMEILIGRHTPTHKDIAFNLPKKKSDAKNLFPGQQDCIDEAFNTTVYLKLLQQNGLLKYHKVIEQAYRKSLWDQHWAGHIEEIASGKKYVVDSWFQPNGYLPVVQESEQWHDISPLTALVDDSREETKTTKKKPSLWKKIIGAE